MKKTVAVITICLMAICIFIVKSRAESETYIEKDMVVLDSEYKYVHGNLFYNMAEGYVEYEDGEFSLVSQQQKDLHVNYEDIDGNINYTYCDYNNGKYIKQAFTDRKEDTSLFHIEIQNNKAYAYVCKNPTHEGYMNRYPLEFDLDTGEYNDFLAGVTINGKRLRDYWYLNQWNFGDKYIYVTVNPNDSSSDSSEIYRIDLKDYSVQKVSENEFSIVNINETKGKYDIIKKEGELFLRNLSAGSDTKINLPGEAEMEKLCINEEEDKLLMVYGKIYIMDLRGNDIVEFNTSLGVSNIDFVNKGLAVSGFDFDDKKDKVKYYIVK